jgi:putative ABC transport system substrate-binding protein
LAVERKAAEGRYELLPELASQLVQSRSDLIIAISPPAARAAKNATSQIPIVFLYVGDPVGVGLAESLARPGGNVTGVATFVPGGMMSKALQVVRDLLPTARRVSALINPANEVAMRLFAIEAPLAASQLGFEIDAVEVRSVGEIPASIDGAKTQGADALWVVGDPMFHFPPSRVPGLAAAAGLPALYLPKALVEAGGLMSYSPDFDEIARRGAHYVDRILRGAAPGWLPVEQPTTYQLVINLKTAKALGLTIPPTLLARADEVIE